MIIVDRGKFLVGSALLLAFVVVLILMFVPLFGPQRNLHFIDYAQQILNSLAKGSAYFIPKLRKDLETWKGKELNIELSVSQLGKNPDEARALAEKILSVAIPGGYELQDGKLFLRVDIGLLLEVIVNDSEEMYFNKGEVIRKKYQVENEKAVLRFWHTLLSRVERKLYVEEKKFAEAEIIKEIKIKAVEPAHNYYGTPISNVRENPIPLALLLIWYIIYTIWYGIGTLYFFEGLGLTAKKPKKKREI